MDRMRTQQLGWALGLVPPLWLVWWLLNDAWLAGLAAALLAATCGALLAPGLTYRWRPLRLLGFVLFFIRESLRGGVDVAWRALHPQLPIAPGWVRHPLWLPAGQPRTLFVALVSLVPGTLCAEVDVQAGVLHVHVLTRTIDDGLAELQARVGTVFGLEPAAGTLT
jgi:multicomponent Na+:H+ antiporter subunit E